MTDSVSFETTNLDNRFRVGFYRRRLNRFVMVVELEDGSEIEAFCPNTSRLIGLLDDGVAVLLTRNNDPDRKTNFTVRAFRDHDTWVGIEAVRANELFEEYLERGDEKEHYGPHSEWEREVTLHDSQLDFRRTWSAERSHWVEVKSLSSRASAGDAFYSGTPSKRGYRHLEDLSKAVLGGDRADCVFVVQRDDVAGLSPAEVTEEDWLEALRSAKEAGVGIRAYRCRFDGSDWTIADRIPTEL